MIGAVIVVGTGWQGGTLLALFFVSGSALTYSGRDRTEPGGRNWRQVLANGLLPALGAVMVALGYQWGWLIVGGALATAQADTWATEIGRRQTRRPRLVTTWERVPIGTSGAISFGGTLGGVGGAALMGWCVMLLGVGTTRDALIVATSGVVGMFADSVLGATVQAQFRCAACGALTETSTHCGERAVHERGVHWLDNDWVNVLGAATGGAIALAMNSIG